MTDEGAERAVYVQHIDPEYREEYVRAHNDVPDAVTDAMERAGVREFELYVRGEVAVCVLEAADLDAYFEAIEDDEGVEEWERHVAQFKTEGVDVDADEDVVPTMDRIWSFEPD